MPLDLLLEDDIRPPLVLLRVLNSEVHSDLLDLLGAGKLGGAVLTTMSSEFFKVSTKSLTRSRILYWYRSFAVSFF